MRQKATILTVDDNQVILATVASLLKADYTVIPVIGGKVALKYLDKKCPDLILLDWDMPDINGIEVLRKVKKNPRLSKIPVIFLTANADAETEVTALNEGAVDYILKPIVGETLISRVRTHLELNEYRRNLEMLVQQKTEQLIRREEMTFDLLANITDFRDKVTGGHVVRTTRYVEVLLKKLRKKNIPEYHIELADEGIFISSAKLHDIGKIGIRDALLMKTGALTPEEYEEMKLHTVYGAEILQKAFKDLDDRMFLNTACEMALTHQERWNGSGYPKGLKGAEIPVSGRIMALADVYDALVSTRPYKRRMTHKEAYDIITSESGVSFDPLIVEVFKESVDEFEKLSVI